MLGHPGTPNFKILCIENQLVIFFEISNPKKRGKQEAFAAQVLACTRSLGLKDDDPRINPNGGAIALGHPLGMSGARLLLTAALQLQQTGGRYALCTMCIGVGQGYATIIERV